MLISVIGICKRSRRARNPAGKPVQIGFTLIEILVVVVIVSIVASAALLSLNLHQGRDGKEEASRLTALVKLASQQAIVSGRELAVEVAKDSYRFLVYQEQQWLPVEDDVLKPRDMPEGISLNTYINGGVANNEEKQEEQVLPRIYLLSSGEMTPFEVVVKIDGSRTGYRVTGGAGGRLVLAEE